MRSLRLAISGLRSAVAHPLVPVTVWAASLLVALPAALVVGDTLRRSIGDSEAGERLLEGFDFGWHGELMSRSGGLLETFEPGRLVSGGWLTTLDAWWGGDLFSQPVPILAFGALFALVWVLLSAAALAHFHRPPRRFSLGEFLGDGGSYFFRFLRLTLLAAPLYYGIFRLARWLFPRIESATQDVTWERTILIYNLLAAVVIVLLIVTVKASFDFARISMVVEERRSAFLAALRGLGFVARRPLSVYGLLLTFSLLALAALVARLIATPGVGESSLAGVIFVFALGQVFLMVRLTLRLGLLAAELALYEEETR